LSKHYHFCLLFWLSQLNEPFHVAVCSFYCFDCNVDYLTPIWNRESILGEIISPQGEWVATIYFEASHTDACLDIYNAKTTLSYKYTQHCLTTLRIQNNTVQSHGYIHSICPSIPCLPLYPHQ